MKFIICDSAREKWGKTETLSKVIDKLRISYAPVKFHTEGRDSYAFFKLQNGKTVFISTLGDPGSGYMNWWNIGINLEADIIVCACRTSGDTLNNLVSLADANQYESIWFKNFYMEHKGLTKTPIHAFTKDIEVKCLYELIHSL